MAVLLCLICSIFFFLYFVFCCKNGFISCCGSVTSHAFDSVIYMFLPGRIFPKFGLGPELACKTSYLYGSFTLSYLFYFLFFFTLFFAVRMVLFHVVVVWLLMRLTVSFTCSSLAEFFQNLVLALSLSAKPLIYITGLFCLCSFFLSFFFFFFFICWKNFFISCCGSVISHVFDNVIYMFLPDGIFPKFGLGFELACKTSNLYGSYTLSLFDLRAMSYFIFW